MHASDLLKGFVTRPGEYVLGAVLTGPALLFPRVGLITPGKLCVLGTGQQVTFSDCDLGAVSEPKADAEVLKRAVLAAWPAFASAYWGRGRRT